jgi:hypothetical protein
MTNPSLQSRILEELSYTDLEEEALGKLVKAPVHRELVRMAKEGLVASYEHEQVGGAIMWGLK